MSSGFLRALAGLDLPEGLKKQLAELAPAPLPYSDELIGRLSLVRTFTPRIFEAAAASLGPGTPAFEAFSALSEVQPILGYRDRFAIEEKTRTEILRQAISSPAEWRDWALQLAGLLDPKHEIESLDRLQLLLVCDRNRGTGELTSAFEAADSTGDIPQMGALVQLVAAIVPLASDLALGSLLRQLEARYRSRSLFYNEFLQTASLFPRPDIEKELDDFVKASGSEKWIFHIHATGGMGKTTLLRRMISRNWVVGAERYPCAWLDFDYLDVHNILKVPWLLALPLAAQWNEQLESPAFSGILTTSFQPLAALLFRSRVDGAAQGLASASLDHLSRSQYQVGRSNPMRCGILAGAAPPATSEARDQLFDSAKEYNWLWDSKLPDALAEIPSGRPALLFLDTLEEASVQYSSELRKTLLLIRDLRNKAREWAKARGRAVDLKLILSGRHQLGERGHVPEFSQDFANQFAVRQLTGLADPQASDFLRQRLRPEQYGLIDAMVSKSEGTPFNLSLFAEWAAEDPALNETTIRRSESTTTVMLIERIVRRIPYQPLRWIIRYGSVPRQLTIDFLENVMQQPLIDALSGQSKAKGSDNPQSELEKDTWVEEKGFVFDAQKLWNQHVLRYAAAKGWMEPAGDAVCFRADILNPMRLLLSRQPIFGELHRAAAARFEALWRSPSPSREAAIEWLYHLVQLRTVAGEPPKDLTPDLEALFAGLSGNAFQRQQIANTLLSSDFVHWIPPERAWLEYRLAEAIAADSGYRYLTGNEARHHLLHAFEIAGTQNLAVFPPFAHQWKRAADGAPVSLLSEEMKRLPEDDAAQLALLIDEMSGSQSNAGAIAIRQVLVKPGKVVPRAWLSERLARYYRTQSPAESVVHFKEAARDFAAHGDLQKRTELLTTASRIELSLGCLDRAIQTVEPLQSSRPSTPAVILQSTRIELSKGEPGRALALLKELPSSSLDVGTRLEAAMLNAGALSQRILWSEAQQQWEQAFVLASEAPARRAARDCVVGLVKLGAWWLRRTDRMATLALTDRADPFSANLPSAELEIWRIALAGDQRDLRRRITSQLGVRPPATQLRLLLALASFGISVAEWERVLDLAGSVTPSVRIVALVEPALLGQPPDLRPNMRRRVAEAMKYVPEGPIEAAWYAIRHGELLAWLGFHDEAVELLAGNVSAISTGTKVEPWKVATYRERRRIEQRLRGWNVDIDPAPDPIQLWTTLWSHTPFRLSAVLVENAQRAYDDGKFSLASDCLRLAQPVLKQTPFETEFHQTNARLRLQRELDRAGKIEKLDRAPIEPEALTRSFVSQDYPETEIHSLRMEAKALFARRGEKERRISSDSPVQDVLLQSRGIPRRLVSMGPEVLSAGVEEILNEAFGETSSRTRVGLRMPFGPLSAVPWEIGFRGFIRPFRTISGYGEYRLESQPEPPLPGSIPVMIFPISPQDRESPSINIYFETANSLKAQPTLDAISGEERPICCVYIAGAFEELGSLSEPVIAGLRATPAMVIEQLERARGRSRPAVILDVPAVNTGTDEIHQLMMRNYFAQSLLDSGMVNCVLATGLRGMKATRDVHRALQQEFQSLHSNQVDLLDQISSPATSFAPSDALFTRNPYAFLAGRVQAYA